MFRVCVECLFLVTVMLFSFFRLFRVFSRFCRLGRLLFSISQVSYLVPVKEERNKAQELRARRGQGQMLGHGR
jgi:hypothetical protein